MNWSKKSWNTPTLPDNNLEFQLHPLIIILSVLGGISTIYLLSNKGLNYTNYILCIAILFTFITHIFLTIELYICITFKSNKLYVRNSLLDHMACICNRMILCAKGVCDQTQPVGIVIGIMLGVYTAL